MKNLLSGTIDSIKDDGTILLLDEAKIKNSVVLKILFILGWDTSNLKDVVPEYTMERKKVDLALISSGKPHVFIEVKRPAKENLEPHQEQLLEYSFRGGVKLSVLTNGLVWWFYLPLQEGSWEQRRFYALDIREQTSSDVAERLIEFLEKEGVSTGQAFKRAEEVQLGKKNKELLKETLPEAWKKLIGEPELFDLVSETTESLCGLRPDVKDIEEFLQSEIIAPAHKDSKEITVSSMGQQSLKKIKTSSANEKYTGTDCERFLFLGKEYHPETWRELLSSVAEEIYRIHGADFEKCLSLGGTKRLYFSKNKNELKSPKNIAGSSFYFEVANFTANLIVKITKELMGLFGYKDSDLQIETRTTTRKAPRRT